MKLIFNKKNGGLGRTAPSVDMISALVMSGIAMTDGVQLNTAYQLSSLEDAEDLLVDGDYDNDTANSSANPKLLHYHISEFYRMNPSGVLWLLVVAQSSTLANMVDDSLTLYNILNTQSGGKLRRMAIGLNPLANYTPTLTDGLDAQVLAAVPKAQALYELVSEENHQFNIFIEGRSFNGTIGAAQDLSTLSSSNVSIVIGADNDVSTQEYGSSPATSAIILAHAAIGTFLGTSSAAKVNEDISWVEKFNLQGNGNWLNPGLSNGFKLTKFATADYNTLDGKRYIFPIQYSEIAGAYWNDSHVCDVIADNDFAYIENSLTVDKAIRQVRALVLPKLGAPLLVDPTDGTLAPEVCKMFENLARKALSQMMSDQEISGMDAYCDPKQNVLSTSQLTIAISIIPTGTARTIEVNIGFTNPAVTTN